MKKRKIGIYGACAVAAALAILQAPGVFAQPARGGFVENPGNAVGRGSITGSALRAFIPERGGFTFPPPYNTQAVRLTNAADCAGRDCVNYAGYSY